ncbi:MAG: TIGR01777 family oxidoreductase [Longimicrobiales bacterium]
MRFAITGSSGLIGTALREYLADEGHSVTRVVRSLSGVGPAERAVVWHPREGAIEAAGLEGHDVVINLAGESIAGLWTEAKKRRIRESRVQGTTLLAETLAALDAPPRVWFSASAFGYYGDRDPGVAVTESSPPGEGFLAEVGREWEASTRAAEDAGIRVVHMRFANVLDPEGGILQVFIPLFKLGLGAKFGSGDQVWPWIVRAEIPPALLHVLAHEELRGPVNFAAPRPVTNREFTEVLGSVVGRPVLFRVPEFAARLAPGGMGEEMLLSGARVIPEKLQQSGYSFRYPELRAALKSLLQ